MPYTDQFEKLIDNLLIKMLINLKHGTTEAEQTKQVTAFLKSALTKPCYKSAKKDIKTLLQIAKKDKKLLNKVIELSEIVKPEFDNDYDNIVHLLREIERAWSTTLLLIPEPNLSAINKNKFIFIKTKDINSHFENKKLIKPIPLVLRTNIKQIMELCSQFPSHHLLKPESTQLSDGFYQIDIQTP
ncbi:DUF2913 family protein (plasmid) [Vibrio sp. SS-MA-C1-2]|uniref:DUF2913 family protein n=1 Tax=Vibrio sp. SS-MA-C1-2 TaxID=2908646 RepID=UPI001F21C539|nr:DUF2913 family protein [Vibrio sp. SS-MA-C1-2]UJF20280.1 DUF2913 family protein [Vibrio sp. SS-MA-C1-2]